MTIRMHHILLKINILINFNMEINIDKSYLIRTHLTKSWELLILLNI